MSYDSGPNYSVLLLALALALVGDDLGICFRDTPDVACVHYFVVSSVDNALLAEVQRTMSPNVPYGYSVYAAPHEDFTRKGRYV